MFSGHRSIENANGRCVWFEKLLKNKEFHKNKSKMKQKQQTTDAQQLQTKEMNDFSYYIYRYTNGINFSRKRNTLKKIEIEKHKCLNK